MQGNTYRASHVPSLQVPYCKKTYISRKYCTKFGFFTTISARTCRLSTVVLSTTRASPNHKHAWARQVQLKESRIGRAHVTCARMALLKHNQCILNVHVCRHLACHSMMSVTARIIIQPCFVTASVHPDRENHMSII